MLNRNLGSQIHTVHVVIYETLSSALYIMSFVKYRIIIFQDQVI